MDRYILSGMYVEALEIISKIDQEDVIVKGYGPRFWHIMNSLYHGLEESTHAPDLKCRYNILKREYRSRLYDNLGDDDIAKLYVRADMMLEDGNAEEILDELLEAYISDEVNTHQKAVLSYLIASACRLNGDSDNAMLYYSISAKNDLCTPVNEYKSLYELAELLYEAGDLSRAYKYINRSVSDAMSANAHINIITINRLLPIISMSYDIQMHRKRIQLSALLIGISLLLLLLIILTFISFKEKKKASEAERLTRKANGELISANERLQEYIQMLKETNTIKEAYIRRYIDLCSEYIGRLEKYRSFLRQKMKTGGMDEIRQELKSTTFLDKELEEFYAQFDATFLDLFPNFTDQLNSLLQPDKRIVVKDKEGILSTELRIFALIRLGIDDSVKIAEFLRRSVSTIYNYRVKVRNAALEDREELEKKVMEIGRL